MLERVGLNADSGKRVGDYSLGMRQRLGIGTALLGDPAVLVLDEPVNGMDPEGIRWMRLLLRDFAAYGGTALLSSHLLGEVQATVDRLIVIRGGRIVADDDLQCLLARQGTTVRGLDPAALGAALRRAGVAVANQADGSLSPTRRPNRSAASPPLKASSSSSYVTAAASRTSSSNSPPTDAVLT